MRDATYITEGESCGNYASKGLGYWSAGSRAGRGHCLNVHACLLKIPNKLYTKSLKFHLSYEVAILLSVITKSKHNAVDRDIFRVENFLCVIFCTVQFSSLSMLTKTK